MTLADYDKPDSPAWWMNKLAQKMLDRNRLLRLAVLDAYRSGRPPLLNVSGAQRQVFYDFLRISKTNFARTIVRAPGTRMRVRAIRTAAGDDENGDEIAWRYWTGAGLNVAETNVHTDMLTFAEDYVRVAVDSNGSPCAIPADPWSTIIIPNPLDPLAAKAAFHMDYDEWSDTTYAYLWLPGEQWVAEWPGSGAPKRVIVPGTQVPGRWRYDGVQRFSFSPSQFTMRPNRDDVETPDDGPYCEQYSQQVVPVVPFWNRDGVGEFEEHLDLLDRINHTTMARVVTAAVQAYKQRALQQTSDAKNPDKDRLPDKNPDTGETINWDEIFQPGPDALWKLPPGVSIWESGEVQLQPIISAAQEDIKQLSSVTETPFSLFSPDGINQSAEGAQATRESLVFKVEDRDEIAARSWARVESLMFLFGPDEQRHDASGNDRADIGRMVFDWAPAERYSLAEKAQADAQNKTLSPEMAAAKIWQLTPDEVAINKAQRASALFAQAAVAPPAPAPSAPPVAENAQPAGG